MILKKQRTKEIQTEVEERREGENENVKRDARGYCLTPNTHQTNSGSNSACLKGTSHCHNCKWQPLIPEEFAWHPRRIRQIVAQTTGQHGSHPAYDECMLERDMPPPQVQVGSAPARGVCLTPKTHQTHSGPNNWAASTSPCVSLPGTQYALDTSWHKELGSMDLTLHMMSACLKGTCYYHNCKWDPRLPEDIA